MDFDVNALFNEHDTDHDGRLTVDQVYNLLKALNVNTYKGSVNKVSSPFISDHQTHELCQPARPDPPQPVTVHGVLRGPKV